MRAYSTDLRQRVLQAVDQGIPREQIVAVLQVSRSTIKRYGRQRRETGTMSAKPIPGRPAKHGDALDADLPAQLAAHDKATLEQHCQVWHASHGVRVSIATMSRAIARLGWTRKKNRWVPPSGVKPPVQPGAISHRTSRPTA
ncbi:MAG TPA: helix-turn-helix domain-containing protein [Ktedonobacterales bacterium]|nr:helix-turn-helix domain-containing protein [Ktedonobacterales bacterium]